MTTINATQVIDEYLLPELAGYPPPPDHVGPSLNTSLRFGSIVYDYTCFMRRRFTTCPTFRQSTFYEYTFLWVLILRVHSTSLLYIAHNQFQN